MTRAITYARTSYYDKHGDNIESQIELCREYAITNEYTIVADLVDHNVSGADMTTPGLERALALAARGDYDILVTRELDRFARSLAKQLLVERDFQRHNVRIEYVLGEYEETPEGQLTKHVRAVIAEYEREKITERMTRGRYRAAQRGAVMVTNNAPYGYRIVRTQKDGRDIRTLEIIESEAAVIRLIFQWYVYGDDSLPLSLRAIAAKLTETRIPSPGDFGKSPRRKTLPFGQWRNETIRNIIMRRTYVGEWIYHTAGGDIIVEVPGIIDHAIYAKAQRRRTTARAASKRNTRHQYLLQGRVFCAACGYRIHALRRAYGQYVYHYYRCPGSQAKENLARACKSPMYRADHVDAAVWQWLREVLANPAEFGYQLDDSAAEAEQVAGRVATIERAVLDNRDRINRLANLYSVGRHTLEVVIEQQRQLESEIARLDDERLELLAQLDDAVARQAHARDVERLVAELADGLAVAGLDFDKMRWIIEMLDITARLETRGKKDKVAHLDVGGRFFVTVPIVPNINNHSQPNP